MLAVDIMQLPLTKKGNKYVFVFIDYYIRFVEAFARKTENMHDLAVLLVEEISMRYGPPKKLLSDRGQIFLSKLATEIYTILKIKKKFTSAYHPQTDGMVERFNSTLRDMLSTLVNMVDDDWDEYLPQVIYDYNTSKHSVTKFTPYELMFGMKPTPIHEMLEEVNPMSTMEYESYIKNIIEGFKITNEIKNFNENVGRIRKEKYHKGKRNVTFHLHDIVLFGKPNRKPNLFIKYFGPFIIYEVEGKNTFRIRNIYTGKKYKSPVNGALLYKYN